MLFMTYSVSGKVDGTGSQYQKMLNVICFCLTHGYTFLYDYHPTNMDHFDEPCSKEGSECQQVERFFGLSKVFEPVEKEKFDRVEIFLSKNESTPSEQEIRNSFAQWKDWHQSSERILVKVEKPYLLGDVDPSIFVSMKQLKPYLQSLPLNDFTPGNFNIVLHARRGDVKPESYYTSELTQKSYSRYNSVKELEDTIVALQNKYPTGVFYLVTESTDDEFNSLVKNYQVQLLNHQSVVDSLNHMIHADVFVLSPSSFSYLCGLYNDNIVYYRPFWHSYVPGWENINSLIDVNQQEGFQGNDMSFFISTALIFLGISLSLLLFCKSNKKRRTKK